KETFVINMTMFHKIFDDFMLEHYIVNSKKNFEEHGIRDRFAFLFLNYSILYYFRVFINKTGYTYLIKDLNEFENVVFKNERLIYEDVLNKIHEVNNKKLEKERRKIRTLKVFENSEVEVYKVDSSREACILLGKGTDWCVANTHTDQHYKEYSSMGDMYVFIFLNMKNSFDGIGPEKALLTLGNKNKDIKSDPLIAEVFKKIINNEFKLTKEIIDNEGTYMNDLFVDLIKSDDFKQLTNMDNFYDQNVKDKEIVYSYFIEIFQEILKTNLIDLSKYYSKENFNIVKISENDPHSDKFYNAVKKSLDSIMIKFYHAAFNIDEVKKRLDGKISPIFKLIDNIYYDHPWILNVRKFSIETIIEVRGSGGRKLIYSIKNSDFKSFFKKVLKYNYYLRDSSNNPFELLPINDEKSEKYEKMLDYMFEWPELEKLVFHIPYEDVKKLSESELLDPVKSNAFIDDDTKMIIDLFSSDNILKLLIKVEEYHYLLQDLKFLKSIDVINHPDMQFLKNFINNWDDYPELVVPFFDINSKTSTSFTSEKNLIDKFNIYFLFFTYKVIKQKEMYDQIKNMFESFYKENIEYWASLGFFDGINESNEVYEAALDVAIYAMTKAETREVESVLFNSYTILKGFFLELLGYINQINIRGKK
ncbi:MAG: hypothetical protein SNJ71_08295, partial [Bacteroidales bacterium]